MYAYWRGLTGLDPWDCKVLEYMARGLSKNLFKEVLFWEELLEGVGGSPSRTLLSVEKLVRFGYLNTNDIHSIREDGGISIYGGLRRGIVLTITGLQFYIAVTGEEPDSLS